MYHFIILDHHGEIKMNLPDENHKRGSKSPKANKVSTYEPYQVKKSCKNNLPDNKKTPEAKRDHKQIQFCLTVTEKSYKLGDTRICKTKTDCKPCEVVSSPTNRKMFGRDKKFEQSKPPPNDEYYKTKGNKKSKGNYKHQQQPVKVNNLLKTTTPKTDKGTPKKAEPTNKNVQPVAKPLPDACKQFNKSIKVKTETTPPKSNPTLPPSPVVSKSEGECGYDIYLTPAQRRNLNSATNQEQKKSQESVKPDTIHNESSSWQQKKQYHKPPNGRSYTNKQKQIHAQKKKNENSQRYNNHTIDKKKYNHSNKKENTKNNLNNGNTKEKMIDIAKTDQAKRKFSDAKNNTIKVLGEVLAQVCETNRSFDKRESKVPSKITLKEDYESICYETLEKLISTVEKELEARKQDTVNSVCAIQPLTPILFPDIDNELCSDIDNKNVSNVSNEMKSTELTTGNIDMIKEFVPHHSIRNSILEEKKVIVMNKVFSEGENSLVADAEEEVSRTDVVSPLLELKDSSYVNEEVSVSNHLSNKLSNIYISKEENAPRRYVVPQQARVVKELNRTNNGLSAIYIHNHTALGNKVVEPHFSRKKLNTSKSFSTNSFSKGHKVIATQKSMDDFNDNNIDLNQDHEFYETSSTSSSDDDFKIELVQNRQISSMTTARNEYNNIQKHIPERNSVEVNHISQNNIPVPKRDTDSQMNNLSVEQIKLIKKIDQRKRVRGLGILECPCSLSLDGERIGYCDVHELFCQS